MSFLRDMDFAMQTSIESSSEMSSAEEESNILESVEQIEKVRGRMDDVSDILVSEKVENLEDDIPSVGKEFVSEKQAYDFYNSYARRTGFSIRKGRLEKTRKGIIRMRILECSKEGHRKVDKRTLNLRKSRPETRTGCKARMVIKLNNDGMWSVTEIAYEHNHSLATEKEAFLLRSQRGVEPIQALKISKMENSGITPTEGYDCLCEEAGGHENLGFTKVDYKNYLRTKRMKELKQGDIQAVLEYLEDKHIEDPMFFHSVQVDNEARMTNFFWADGRAVQDYLYFGDVVCFDATYKTNKYGRPFAPFLSGANFLPCQEPEKFETLLFWIQFSRKNIPSYSSKNSREDISLKPTF